MWLQAALSRADLVTFAERLFPVHLALEEDDESGRHLYLGQPRTLEFVVGEGLRIELRARVRWPLLGIDLPIDVPSVTAMLRLRMAHVDGEDVFAFEPELEALDVSHLPGFVDRGLMKAINAAIAEDHAALTWRFTQTLDFHLRIPEAASHARRVRLAAKWGDVRVTEDGVTIIASLDAEVSARGEPSADEPSIAWAAAKALES